MTTVSSKRTIISEDMRGKIQKKVEERIQQLEEEKSWFPLLNVVKYSKLEILKDLKSTLNKVDLRKKDLKTFGQSRILNFKLKILNFKLLPGSSRTTKMLEEIKSLLAPPESKAPSPQQQKVDTTALFNNVVPLSSQWPTVEEISAPGSHGSQSGITESSDSSTGSATSPTNNKRTVTFNIPLPSQRLKSENSDSAPMIIEIKKTVDKIIDDSLEQVKKIPTNLRPPWAVQLFALNEEKLNALKSKYHDRLFKLWMEQGETDSAGNKKKIEFKVNGLPATKLKNGELVPITFKLPSISAISISRRDFHTPRLVRV